MNTFVKQEQTVMNKTDNWMKLCGAWRVNALQN